MGGLHVEYQEPQPQTFSLMARRKYSTGNFQSCHAENLPSSTASSRVQPRLGHSAQGPVFRNAPKAGFSTLPDGRWQTLSRCWQCGDVTCCCTSLTMQGLSQRLERLRAQNGWQVRLTPTRSNGPPAPRTWPDQYFPRSPRRQLFLTRTLR